MPLFKIDFQKVSQIGFKEDGFGKEAKLRDFLASENNLELLLGIRFLAKEYPTSDGGFIDTLGIDENNAPVIIEYKWKENDEAFTQVFSYSSWLTKNKPHFQLLVKDKLGENIDINWDEKRLILVAQGFSKRVKAAVQEVDIVELITYGLYEGDILHVETEYEPTSKKRIRRVDHEQRGDREGDFGLEYHMQITSPDMQKLAQELRQKILLLPSVEEKLGQKTGITYRTTKSFARLEFRGTWIQVLLRDPSYPEDTQRLIKDITSNEWGYSGMFRFTSETNVNYLLDLIKASYNSTL